MALFKTDLVRRDAKLDRWAALRFNLKHPWGDCVDGFLAERNLESTEFDPARGTIGGGNGRATHWCVGAAAIRSD